jgi:hypothetical protein
VLKRWCNFKSRREAWGSDDMKSPVFVLSTGRCGTLALQRFLQRSQQIEAFHRYRGRAAKYRNDMSFVLEQNYAYYHVLKSPDSGGKKRRFVVGNLQRCRRALIQRLHQEGKGFVELNHEFSPFGPLLAEAFPDAKFVHLIRNPRSVVSSFMQKLAPTPMSLPAFMGTRYSIVGQYVLRYGHIERLAKLAPSLVQDFVASHRFDTHLHPFEWVNRKWQENREMPSFEKTCWYWNEINGLTVEFFHRLTEERKHRMYFEEIFEPEPNEAQQTFLDFFGVGDLAVEELAAFSQVKVNVKQVRNPFPSPEEWDEGMVRVMNHYCQGTMQQIGYS